MKIDQKDRQLLYELDLDCRQSLGELGKKTNLSKQAVHARMERMKRNGVIHSFSIVFDRSKLGQTEYELWVQLSSMEPTKKTEFENYLIEHELVYWLISCGGTFDYAFGIMVSDVFVFNEFLKSLFSKYPEFIKNHHIVVVTSAELYPRSHLIAKDTLDRKGRIYWKKPKRVEVDETDLQLLRELAKNSRIPTIELAKITKSSPATIKSRIKRLETEQVIEGYRVVMQPTNAGFQTYDLLLSIHNMTQEQAKKLETYCRLNPYIYVYVTSIGRWNIDIELDAENQEHFHTILEEIKREFGPIIREYLDVPMLSVKKFI